MSAIASTLNDMRMIVDKPRRPRLHVLQQDTNIAISVPHISQEWDKRINQYSLLKIIETNRYNQRQFVPPRSLYALPIPSRPQRPRQKSIDNDRISLNSSNQRARSSLESPTPSSEHLLIRRRNALPLLLQQRNRVSTTASVLTWFVSIALLGFGALLLTIQVNGAPYERVGVLGKGGSSKVYSVICPAKRVIYALKRVTLERADAETYQSYTNEIELLKRLRGHDRVIQLIDHQITFGQGNRPKVLMMVSDLKRTLLIDQVMECGEIDFAMLLEEQRGKPLNLNFVGLYWEQVSMNHFLALTIDAASRTSGTSGERRTYRSQACQLRLG